MIPSHYRRSCRLVVWLLVLVLCTWSAEFSAVRCWSAVPTALALPGANGHTLQADFLCQKQLPELDTILVSRGTVFLEAPDHLRLATTWPYTSDIILVGNKVLAKSQHESGWAQNPFPPRPGLSMMMTHLAAAALGDLPGKTLAEMYGVSALADPIPAPAEHAEWDGGDAEMFVLRPINKDLQKSIQELRLAFDAHSHVLIFAQITARQGDVVRYWFTNIRLNPALSADTFAPTAHP